MALLDQAREILATLQSNDFKEKGWPSALAHHSLKEREKMLDKRLFLQEEEKRKLFNELSKLQQEIAAGEIDQDLSSEALNIDDLDQFLKGLQETPLPTIYEDPLYYKILLLLLPYVKRGYEDEAYQRLVAKILFGSRPKNDTIAQFFIVEEGKSYIIAFQHGLLEFLYKACHILFKFATPPINFDESWSLRPEAGSLIDADQTGRIKLDATTDMYELVTSMVINDSVEGQSSNYQSKSAKTNLKIFNTYVLPIFLFVFHHEISHLVLNHDLEPKRRSWIDEMQADVMAFQRVLKTLESKLPTWIIINAILSFFDLLEMIERTRSVIATTEEFKSRPSSHPYPRIRKQYFMIMARTLLKDNPQESKTIEASYAVSENIFEFIWDNIYTGLLMQKQLNEELKPYGS